MNVRDKQVSQIMNRRLIIGEEVLMDPIFPMMLPKMEPIAELQYSPDCADISRQFEFLISVWANDLEFRELNEHDPSQECQDGSYGMTIPKADQKKLKVFRIYNGKRWRILFSSRDKRH